jgi:hypothetical protein
MLPQFNRLIEASFVRDESSASKADATVIPAQHRVTQQILSHWQPFQDLKLMFAGSRRAEQLSLRSQQRVVTTVEESVLKTVLTVGMSPGLLVFGRHLSPRLWVLRSR